MNYLKNIYNFISGFEFFFDKKKFKFQTDGSLREKYEKITKILKNPEFYGNSFGGI